MHVLGEVNIDEFDVLNNKWHYDNEQRTATEYEAGDGSDGPCLS